MEGEGRRVEGRGGGGGRVEGEGRRGRGGKGGGGEGGEKGRCGYSSALSKYMKPVSTVVARSPGFPSLSWE